MLRLGNEMLTVIIDSAGSCDFIFQQIATDYIALQISSVIPAFQRTISTITWKADRAEEIAFLLMFPRMRGSITCQMPAEIPKQ